MVRKYFYHQDCFGHLFLSSTIHKNFTTRYTHIPFLNLFYRQLRCSSNEFISKCGLELNYLTYERSIIIYHSLTDCLLYGGGGVMFYIIGTTRH
jgi:Domain of unknown function (DUF4505)